MKLARLLSALILLCLACAFLVICFTSCAGNAGNGAPTVSLDLLNGACVRSTDGTYFVCWNPLTKQVSARAVSGGQPVTLTFDRAARQWRGEFADGSTVTYRPGEKPVIEPPLPH